MAITYPPDCDSPRRKTEWLYIALELLRHVHNLFSYWYHNEITQAQYDNPPLPDVPVFMKPLVKQVFTYLKNKYPFKPQLNQEDWDEFYRNDFKSRSRMICTQINIQRKLLKESTQWEPDIENI